MKRAFLALLSIFLALPALAANGNRFVRQDGGLATEGCQGTANVACGTIGGSGQCSNAPSCAFKDIDTCWHGEGTSFFVTADDTCYIQPGSYISDKTGFSGNGTSGHPVTFVCDQSVTQGDCNINSATTTGTPTLLNASSFDYIHFTGSLPNGMFVVEGARIVGWGLGSQGNVWTGIRTRDRDFIAPFASFKGLGGGITDGNRIVDSILWAPSNGTACPTTTCVNPFGLGEGATTQEANTVVDGLTVIGGRNTFTINNTRDLTVTNSFFGGAQNHLTDWCNNNESTQGCDNMTFENSVFGPGSEFHESQPQWLSALGDPSPSINDVTLLNNAIMAGWVVPSPSHGCGMDGTFVNRNNLYFGYNDLQAEQMGIMRAGDLGAVCTSAILTYSFDYNAYVFNKNTSNAFWQDFLNQDGGGTANNTYTGTSAFPNWQADAQVTPNDAHSILLTNTDIDPALTTVGSVQATSIFGSTGPTWGAMVKCNFDTNPPSVDGAPFGPLALRSFGISSARWGGTLDTVNPANNKTPFHVGDFFIFGSDVPHGKLRQITGISTMTSSCNGESNALRIAFTPEVDWNGNGVYNIGTPGGFPDDTPQDGGANNNGADWIFLYGQPDDNGDNVVDFTAGQAFDYNTMWTFTPLPGSAVVDAGDPALCGHTAFGAGTSNGIWQVDSETDYTDNAAFQTNGPHSFTRSHGRKIVYDDNLAQWHIFYNRTFCKAGTPNAGQMCNNEASTPECGGASTNADCQGQIWESHSTNATASTWSSPVEIEPTSGVGITAFDAYYISPNKIIVSTRTNSPSTTPPPTKYAFREYTIGAGGTLTAAAPVILHDQNNGDDTTFYGGVLRTSSDRTTTPTFDNLGYTFIHGMRQDGGNGTRQVVIRSKNQNDTTTWGAGACVDNGSNFACNNEWQTLTPQSDNATDSSTIYGAGETGCASLDTLKTSGGGADYGATLVCYSKEAASVISTQARLLVSNNPSLGATSWSAFTSLKSSACTGQGCTLATGELRANQCQNDGGNCDASRGDDRRFSAVWDPDAGVIHVVYLGPDLSTSTGGVIYYVTVSPGAGPTYFDNAADVSNPVAIVTGENDGVQLGIDNRVSPAVLNMFYIAHTAPNSYVLRLLRKTGSTWPSTSTAIDVSAPTRIRQYVQTPENVTTDRLIVATQDNIVGGYSITIRSLSENVSGAAVCDIGPNESQGTITPPGPLNFTVADAGATESNVTESACPVFPSSVGALCFTISQSGVSDFDSTINYATTGGTAVSGTDFTATSGTAHITAGNTSVTIAVPVLGDTLYETTEAMTFTISGAINPDPNKTVAITDSTATGTIGNDDAIPTLAITTSIPGFIMTEGATPTITGTLSAAAGTSITVTYASQDGSATSGGTNPDYVAASGSWVFAAGDTSKTFVLTTIDDTIFEPSDEVLSLNFTSALVGFTPVTSIVTIQDTPDPGGVSGTTPTIRGFSCVGCAFNKKTNDTLELLSGGTISGNTFEAAGGGSLCTLDTSVNRNYLTITGCLNNTDKHVCLYHYPATGTTNKVVFMIQGGRSTALYQDGDAGVLNENAIAAQQAAGVRIIQLAWLASEGGLLPDPGAVDGGTSPRFEACQLDTIINYVHATYTQGLRPLCAIGNSNGADAIANSLAFFGAYDKLDAVYLGSGPISTDLYHGCTQDGLDVGESPADSTLGYPDSGLGKTAIDEENGYAAGGGGPCATLSTAAANVAWWNANSLAYSTLGGTACADSGIYYYPETWVTLPRGLDDSPTGGGCTAGNCTNAPGHQRIFKEELDNTVRSGDTSCHSTQTLMETFSIVGIGHTINEAACGITGGSGGACGASNDPDWDWFITNRCTLRH